MEYFQCLLVIDRDDGALGNNGIAWLGIGSTGKSFGLGVGSASCLLQLLGFNILTFDLMDRDDEAKTASPIGRDVSGATAGRG